MSISKRDMFDEMEADFHVQVKAAYLSGQIEIIDDFEAVCPVCGGVMDFCERGDRMTFAGPEKACVQYHCDSCGTGSEMAVRDDFKPHKRDRTPASSS